MCKKNFFFFFLHFLRTFPSKRKKDVKVTDDSNEAIDPKSSDNQENPWNQCTADKNCKKGGEEVYQANV